MLKTHLGRDVTKSIFRYRQRIGFSSVTEGFAIPLTRLGHFNLICTESLFFLGDSVAVDFFDDRLFAIKATFYIPQYQHYGETIGNNMVEVEIQPHLTFSCLIEFAAVQPVSIDIHGFGKT